MFEHISVLSKISIGKLAELLLFYKKVTLYANEDQIRSLFKSVNPEILIPFLEEHRENITLQDISWGVWASVTNKKMHFQLGDERTLHVDEPYLGYLSRTSYLDTPDGNIQNSTLTRKFLSLVTINRVSDDIFEGILAKSTLKSELHSFSRQYQKVSHPLQQIPRFSLSLGRSFSGFDISINLSEDTKTDELNVITNAIILYVSTLLELPFWATQSSEILADETTSLAVKLKIDSLIQRHKQSKGQIGNFQDIFVGEARNISEAINSGSRSFSDFVKIYEKSHKFRNWIQNHPPDTNILKEYYQSVISDSWTERLPTKIARWSLFTGIGLGIDILGAGRVGTLTGVTLGAFDTFLLDSIIRGWKPNQFIDNDLRAFVRS